MKAASAEGEKDQENEIQLEGDLPRPSIRRMLSLLAPDWPLLVLAFINMVIAAVSEAMIPHLLSRTLQSIIDGQAAGTLTQSTFMGPLRKMFSAAAANAFFASLRGACFIRLGARISLRLRRTLFKALLNQDMGFFDKTKTGEITSRLTQDCERVADQVSYNVNIFSRTVIQIITMLCFMLRYSKDLTLLSFSIVPVIAILSKKVGSIMKGLSEETQKQKAEANAVAEEALSAIPTVRTFAGEHREDIRFFDKLKGFVDLEQKRAKIYIGYLTTSMILPQLGTAIVMYRIGLLCMRNAFPAANMLAFILYMQQLNGGFGSLADIYTSIMQALGSASRVFQLIDRKPAGSLKVSEKIPSAAGVPHARGHLELKNVSFGYPTRPGRLALQNLNLECRPGEVVALVGPSGGGKSTCIGLLQRLYEQQHGSVLLDGMEVRDYDSTVFSQIVTVVSQEPVLFGSTVEENIMYGLPDDHPTRQNLDAVIRAAKMANAHDFISALPEGYKTQVSERGASLSGGQKQRIAIARALVRKPRVLLLDEATSALDAESELLVQQAINNLISQEDLTVVIVAHRLSTVKKANKIFVVQAGQVVEGGSHEELLKLPSGRYQRLVKSQLQGPSDELCAIPAMDELCQ